MSDLVKTNAAVTQEEPHEAERKFKGRAGRIAMGEEVSAISIPSKLSNDRLAELLVRSSKARSDQSISALNSDAQPIKLLGTVAEFQSIIAEVQSSRSTTGLETSEDVRAAAAVPDEHRALNKALEFAVLTIAFIGRDRGTDRLDGSLDGLVEIAVQTDKIIRDALAAMDREPITSDEMVEAFGQAFWAVNARSKIDHDFENIRAALAAAIAASQ